MPRQAGRGTGPVGERPIGQAQPIANIVFSICAGLASLLVAVLSAAKGAPAVAVVFGLLFAGFMLRAREGHRRRRGL
jgi:hypothetical protein